MRNINKKVYFLSLLAAAGFTSCTNDVDQNYPDPNVGKPVVTITSDSNSIVELDNEATEDVNEARATFTVTADRMYNTDMKFKLEFIPGESTGSLEDVVITLDDSPIDFGSTGFLIILPKNTLSTTFQIRAEMDAEFEQAETFTFRVYPVGDLNGLVDPSSQTITLTINNSASDALSLTFDWDQTFNLGGTDYTLCELGYDIDILVYDSNGDMFGGGAQTGDCPEHLDMSLADYPDGTYDIFAFLYDDGPDDLGSFGITPAFDIPVNISYIREGSQTLTQGGMFSAPAFNSSSPNFINNGDLTEIYLMTVVVSNGTFTIQQNGNTIASGRQASAQSLKKAKL